MAKENKKVVPEPRAVAPATKKSAVTRSIAKRIKNEWRRLQKAGDKRSLREYAKTTDGGPGWLMNKM